MHEMPRLMASTVTNINKLKKKKDKDIVPQRNKTLPLAIRIEHVIPDNIPVKIMRRNRLILIGVSKPYKIPRRGNANHGING